MKLKDLKQGMVCELRNGEFITVLEGGSYYNLNYQVRPYLVDRYNDDLTHKVNKLLDIMKVTYGDKVVFERKESRWFVPDYDEEYFYINDYGRTSSTINMQLLVDTDILNNSRVFKTKEEAEKRLRQQQATLSVERWIAENDVEVDLYDTNVSKYFITYGVSINELKIDCYLGYINIPKQFILSSKEKALQLIKEREKELKIMFGVKE